MKVFIDLEETLINNWNDKLFRQSTTRIKNWIKLREVNEIHIWSFAIWNDEDKKHFITSKLMHDIEVALECKIISYPSVEEIQKLVEQYEGIIYENRLEFMQLNGKCWSFVKYCLGYEKNESCILIDDAVPNLFICDVDQSLTIQLINVSKI